MKSIVNVILTGTPSDSYSWNLIFMELFLKENGCQVRNLGACVPSAYLHQAITESLPDLVVISSLNGHLFQDAIEIINTFSKAFLTQLPPPCGWWKNEHIDKRYELSKKEAPETWF